MDSLFDRTIFWSMAIGCLSVIVIGIVAILSSMNFVTPPDELYKIRHNKTDLEFIGVSVKNHGQYVTFTNVHDGAKVTILGDVVIEEIR